MDLRLCVGVLSMVHVFRPSLIKLLPDQIPSMLEVTSTEFEEEPSPTKEVQAKKQEPPPPATKLNQNFYERTRTTIYMLITFIVILAAGQPYCFVLVQILNLMIFLEINNIKRNQEKEVNIPMTKYINWYIFIVVNYYCLGNFITVKLPLLGVWSPFVASMLQFHQFICYSLSVAGLLAFVLSLKQGYLKYQFRLFGWIVMAAILVCLQTWLICNTLFEGIIWFILPCMLIIVNDIFAYIFGYFLGTHQLIAISPKKTWEGYLGGALSTIVLSIVFTEALQTIQGIACPMYYPSLTPFMYPTCSSTLFEKVDLKIITITVLQGHMMIISLFASLIGPFGGFFASGLKRAIKIKDFANLIPGHGGVSDRMDCQLIMGAFVYFYFLAFIRSNTSSPTSFLIGSLSPIEQLAIFTQLKQKLQLLGMVR